MNVTFMRLYFVRDVNQLATKCAPTYLHRIRYNQIVKKKNENITFSMGSQVGKSEKYEK